MTPHDFADRAVTLAALADETAATDLESPDARERARRLRDHLHAFVLPRARSLDAPLVVLLFGPTGAGKSSLANAIAGREVSPTGVLRPTTRQAILLATPSDGAALLEGPLAGLAESALTARRMDWPPGVAIVDSPDIDSVETANRDLADRLVEAADMAVFVTTAARYADRVPWHVLRRAAERRLPLLVVVNRLPRDAAARAEVLDDVRRLLAESDLVGADAAGRLTLVPVVEGDLESDGVALSRTAAAPILERTERLRGDAEARRTLAARSLAGSLAGLEPLLGALADDLERAAIDADALRRTVESAYRGERAALAGELRSGAFLRAEVLRRWQDYVGADRLTRSLSGGMARLESSLRSLFRGGADAPVVAVRNETRAELADLGVARAAEAARRASAGWSEDAAGARLLEREDGLWSASPGLRDELLAGVDEWLAAIARSIAESGGPRRRLARGAATGVNAAGVAVMLGVFLHTGGLTGAEVGVAAGTALVNQRLLEAIFGDAAIARLVDAASQRLDALLDEAFATEAARFTALVPDGARLRNLAGRLREEAAWALEAAAEGAGEESGSGASAGAARPSVEVEAGRDGHARGRGLGAAIGDALRSIFAPGRSRA